MERIQEDLTTVLEVSGPHYTEEDCEDHASIGAVIYKNNKILMMDHIKMNCWTISVGKVKPGECVEDCLREEMKEELGIYLLCYNEITFFTRPYIINGICVDIDFYIFNILEYYGEVRNLEPHKHRSLKFMTINEIRKLKKISTATKAILKFCHKLFNY